ncbi:Uncharacterised protein [Mycobacteroides abscessus subsp. abscessus]|nr:Uncharacterised protein [Mycobacteroides abscessus subsp. abscessus]
MTTAIPAGVSLTEHLLRQRQTEITAQLHTRRRVGAATHEVPGLQLRILDHSRPRTRDRRLGPIRHPRLPGVARTGDVVDVIDDFIRQRQADRPAIVGHKLLILIRHPLRIRRSIRGSGQDRRRNGRRCSEYSDAASTCQIWQLHETEPLRVSSWPQPAGPPFACLPIGNAINRVLLRKHITWQCRKI